MNLRLAIAGAWVVLAVVALVTGVPHSDAATSWRYCSGVLRLDAGDSASRISAKNLSCAKARQVIRGPASNLGYACSNPFDHPMGSGGWITCRRGAHAVKFLYGQG